MAKLTKAQKAIEAALSDLYFMEADEKDGTATAATRRIRMQDLRRSLERGQPRAALSQSGDGR